MSYDSSIVLAIKSGLLPVFCCGQGDDDDAAGEVTGTGLASNIAHVHWTRFP
jgi:hypothetical protein